MTAFVAVREVSRGPAQGSVCLTAEKLCGVCDNLTLTYHDHRIVAHGRQGWEKGCACIMCVAWHEGQLRLARRRYRANAINNRGLVNVLRKGL